MATPHQPEQHLQFIEIAFDDEWGEQLTAARTAAGLTQSQLVAQLVGIHVNQATISQIENGAIHASEAVIPLVRRLGPHGLRMPRILFNSELEQQWVTAGVRLLVVNEVMFRALLNAAVAAIGAAQQP